MTEPKIVIVIPAVPSGDMEGALQSVVRYTNLERIVVVDDTKRRAFSLLTTSRTASAISSNGFSALAILRESLLRLTG